MKEWTIKVYVDEKGICDFHEWRKQIPPKARARMRNILSFMEITKDWTRTPYFRPLTDYAGICEIRFIVQNIQYRPLGCYGPGEKEFTFLVGAKEVGRKFNPLSAPDTAIERRNKILKNARLSHGYYEST
jgi:hypothetical protein